MIYIENFCTDPHYNLAFEEYVFTHLCEAEPILLLWQNEPSVIIGKYQNTVEEINTAYIEENGIHVVRRITGGGAVYHDLGNLNYSFIIPDVNIGIDFGTFSRPLVNVLRSFDVEAEQTGRNDITVEGRKISGNAQYFNKNRLLHHGTILYDSRLEDVQKALAVKEGKISSKGIKSVRSRVTNLKPYLKEEMDVLTFQERLLHAFFESEDIRRYELSEEEKRGVEKLSREKYGTWEWNYGNSPKSNISREKFFPGGYVKILLDVDDGRIKNMKVYGDFFGREDLSGFEAAFIGKRYGKEAVHDTLQGIDLRQYFHNITAEEIEELLY